MSKRSCRPSATAWRSRGLSCAGRGGPRENRRWTARAAGYVEGVTTAEETAGARITVRAAGGADAAELVRLRRLMFEAMTGEDLPGPWEADAARMLRERLAPDAMERATTAAFVVDAPGGGLAACAIGTIEQRLPSPIGPTGLFGFVFNVCTDKAHRGRGYARATTAALLEWFAAAGVSRVDLHATEQAESLYRALGFGTYSIALSLDVSVRPPAAAPPSPSL